MTPEQAIERLRALAPCPIIHSTSELPENDPWHGRPRRSCYFWAGKGRWGERAQDYIHINEGSARHWLYAWILAHELGHALDHHKLHPAQHLLKGPRSRFRDELAAVAYAITVIRELGLGRTKRGRRWIDWETVYLYHYTQGKHPHLLDTLKAIKTPIFEEAQR